jgi:hypothetical protein
MNIKEEREAHEVAALLRTLPVEALEGVKGWIRSYTRMDGATGKPWHPGMPILRQELPQNEPSPGIDSWETCRNYYKPS